MHGFHNSATPSRKVSAPLRPRTSAGQRPCQAGLQSGARCSQGPQHRVGGLVLVIRLRRISGVRRAEAIACCTQTGRPFLSAWHTSVGAGVSQCVPYLFALTVVTTLLERPSASAISRPTADADMSMVARTV